MEEEIQRHRYFNPSVFGAALLSILGLLIVLGFGTEDILSLHKQHKVLAIKKVPTPTVTLIPTPTVTPILTPTPTFVPTLTATPTATPTPFPTASPEDVANWDKLAGCETHGNWSADTGNGYYGGLQFSQSAWVAVGGNGNPAQASRDEQILRGKTWQARRGWSAWSECAHKLGLY